MKGPKVNDYVGNKQFTGTTENIRILAWDGTKLDQPGVIDRGVPYPGTRWNVAVSGDINHGQGMSGDRETRLINLTVNTFVKIN